MIAQKIPLQAGLWLVGVPLGTARDITLRALDVLASADHLVAEDTRSLRKLMDIHGIALEGRRVQSLHDHSSAAQMDAVLARIENGQSVAFASEAGMPLIADPGFELVRAARERGLMITAAPGPTAVTTALALSGLATDAFLFVGFLPSSTGQRVSALEALKNVAATLIFYESPKRVAGMLEDAAQTLGSDRQARICRELTKKFEEVRAGSLEDLARGAKETPPRGEIVVLIERELHGETSAETIEAALEKALRDMTTKDAAAFVAKATGAPKRDVYQLALKLKN